MKKSQKQTNQAFTLIELLVVITVLAVLIGISSFGIRGIFENARDTQRRSDLKQYQSALESYANKNNGLFPHYNNGTNLAEGPCGVIGLTTCPDDPLEAEVYYRYRSNGGTGDAGSPTASEYILWAALEKSSNYFVVCSIGTSGETSTAPSGAGTPCPPGLE